MSSAFKKFSRKQLSVLTWWLAENKSQSCTAIICDGAIRSGKTLCLSLSFVFWSLTAFDQTNFALCGKTIGALRRNLVHSLVALGSSLGFSCKDIISRNVLEISYKGRTNRYYLFGGKDEGSAALIQGITLGGVLFDEVALMPRSFVEQALARCSVEGARFWFNCNPEHPSHWFYRDWIQKAEERNAYYIHFEMKDNPSLSPAVLKRYSSLYHGAFYQRFVLGKWTAAHGAVYPMFSKTAHVVESLPKVLENYVVSCDYGTTNPCSFGLWGQEPQSQAWYRIREYYHSSRKTGVTKTDSQYVRDLERLVGGLKITAVVVDPSAASFIQSLRQRGTFNVVPADNRVLNGIQLVAECLTERKIKFHQSCENSIGEFGLYRWNLNSAKDMPIQEHDHAMDDVRYFVAYAFRQNEGSFFALTANRK